MSSIIRRPGSSRLLAIAVAVWALVQAVPTARADGIFDHLECHALKDTLPRGSVRADLFPEQAPLFPNAYGCRVKLPAKLFCVDVEKRNVQPPAPLVVDGDPVGDFFCYQVACPRGTDVAGGVSGFDAEDQFGARRIYVKRPRWLCAPARKLVPTPTSTPTPTASPVFCGDSVYPICDGGCYPSTTSACVAFGSGCACIQFTPTPTRTLLRTPTPTPTPDPTTT